MDVDIEKINKEMKTINRQHQGLRLTDGEIAMTKIVALEERIEKLEQRLEASPLDAVVSVPYQCCPVCQGRGEVLADGFTSAVYKTCDVCNGQKIIPEAIIPQTKEEAR